MKYPYFDEKIMKICFDLSSIHEVNGIPLDFQYSELPNEYKFLFDCRSDSGDDDYAQYSPEDVDSSDLTLLDQGSGKCVLSGKGEFVNPETEDSEDFFYGCEDTGEVQVSFCLADSSGKEISEWSETYTIPCESC